MESKTRDTPWAGLVDDLRASTSDFRLAREQLRPLADDGLELARGEMRLLRAEVAETAARIARAAMWGGAAAVLGLVVLVFAFVSLMLGLDLVMPLWLAALVTLAVATAIVLLAVVSLLGQLKRFSFLPRRTLRSVKEDAAWLQTQTRSMKS